MSDGADPIGKLRTMVADKKAWIARLDAGERHFRNRVDMTEKLRNELEKESS
jgi:hypothetical protein